LIFASSRLCVRVAFDEIAIESKQALGNHLSEDKPGGA
jgi:hypothetical protein